jgi:hypothetical protein
MAGSVCVVACNKDCILMRILAKHRYDSERNPVGGVVLLLCPHNCTVMSPRRPILKSTGLVSALRCGSIRPPGAVAGRSGLMELAVSEDYDDRPGSGDEQKYGRLQKSFGYLKSFEYQFFLMEMRNAQL